MYKSGLIFIYMGHYSRFLVGMSFFKDGLGIETVYCDRNIELAQKYLGFEYFAKVQFHEYGEVEWSRFRIYFNNLTRFSELTPIALKGKESKKDFEDILNALI
jgi:hypothetical protein